MSHADCPHCGARNLSLFSAEDLTRCRECGRTLADESELAELRARVTDAHRRLRLLRGSPERLGRRG